MATRTQPNWQISRGFVGPLGRVFFRPIFTVRAWNEDHAIMRAAHKIRGIAILKATREELEPFPSIVESAEQARREERKTMSEPNE
jgi:hypothetical protein